MKKWIYVVEDNAGIREMIEFLLTEEQYEVKVCDTVLCFWQQMRRHRPDMVVLDVNLPDGSGIDVCTKLKRNISTHAIPVMMMWASNNLNRLKNKCDAEDFINKPFDINDFVHRVEQYLPI